MKPWRVFLLVLLTLLLPLRGAVAGAWLCPPGSHGAPAAYTEHHAADAGLDHLHAQGHAHAHAEHDAQDSDPSQAHSSTCHACASFCSATPLLSAVPGVLQPLETARLSFPGWSAPAAVFLSDGQERPPRTC